MLSQTEKAFGKHAYVGSDAGGFYLRVNEVVLHVGDKIDVLSLEINPKWFADQSIIEIKTSPPQVLISRTGHRPVALNPADIIRISGSRAPLQTEEQMSSVYMKFGKSGGVYKCGETYRLISRGKTYGEEDMVDIIHHDHNGTVSVDGYKIMKISMDGRPRIEIALPGMTPTMLAITDKLSLHNPKQKEGLSIPKATNSIGRVAFDGKEWVLILGETIAKIGDWIEVLIDVSDKNMSNWHEPVQITEITPEAKVFVSTASGASGALEPGDVWRHALYNKPISPVSTTGIPRDFPPINFLEGQIILNNDSTSSFKINGIILNVGDMIDVRERRNEFMEWREGYKIHEIQYSPARIVYIDGLGDYVDLKTTDSVRAHEEPITLSNLQKQLKKPTSVEELELLISAETAESDKFAETDPRNNSIPEDDFDQVKHGFGNVSLEDFERTLTMFENNAHGSEHEQLVLKLTKELRFMFNNLPIHYESTEPYTREELRDATAASSFTILSMVKDDVTASEVASALIAFATDVEKLVKGDKARGFQS